jgi:hypothetical protein
MFNPAESGAWEFIEKTKTTSKTLFQPSQLEVLFKIVILFTLSKSLSTDTCGVHLSWKKRRTIRIWMGIAWR